MTRDRLDVFAPWRIAYGLGSWRRLAWSVVAVPRAVGALGGALLRPGRLRALGGALLALPVAVASTALTAVLAYLVLINVVGYPFRPVLGLAERTGTAWYADAWGGPTLAGAWATHTALILLLVVPPVVWAVRGLTALQLRLTGQRSAPAAPAVASRSTADVRRIRVEPVDVRPAAAAEMLNVRPVDAPEVLNVRPVDAPEVLYVRPGDVAQPVAPPPAVPAGPVDVPPASPLPAPGATVRRDAGATHGRRRPRAGAVLAAAGLLVACSLIAHANGIGDNLLWTPRDLTSGVALAVTLAPVAGLLLLRRTAWWRSPAPLR
ncbi:hypothetical protein GCE86_26720 [Micromonospora terminaliae]|uniref:Uncharacterized protein n=1 Tax=Micromonospora terminaliae TaxID=1914461 RepID=A0AAJ2ZAJ6_9ACTN|nr:hypothetical protein [Micromonospora terminaliae]NES26098.1 hypothetical protein [Micromonospora terminaliae]QGL50298.1 hypothetical protein GCE86_26720 [Micromonospora terminaliae]